MIPSSSARLERGFRPAGENSANVVAVRVENGGGVVSLVAVRVATYRVELRVGIVYQSTYRPHAARNGTIRSVPTGVATIVCM